MKEIFLADKPISEEKDDKFQRYNFSKRIAETIINRTSSDSIVIGLYGAWGEGKTSVLNFIKKELDPHHPNVLHFTFNPWRFADEAALLTSFFNTLASELKKSLVEDNTIDQYNKKKTGWFNRRKGHLKTNTEAIGEIIQEYGKVVSIFGAGEAAETIGKAISNVDVEELKSRIEKLLTDNKRRVVIFIDDIDRLEKNEIHAIFRLVKLTGDFAYTTYVLSFDEHMVSSAIGERFGTGDQKAGLNFLEKIIQIPIKLPLAQKVALKKYCFELIDQSLNASQIILTKDQEQEFVKKFTSNFLIRLTTPRLAVRYGNTLSFSLPLLKEEVNYVDLLLIEGFRVFYPEIYDFVRSHPDYFIGTYGGNSINKEKVEKFEKMFSDFTIKYSLDEIANVKSALSDLFPNLDQIWRSGWNWITETNEKRYNEKRISTSQYFNRYFSYAVIVGDISDVAFTKLLEDITQGDYEENIKQVKNLIQSATPENFIEKLISKEKTLNNITSIALVKVISKLGDCFPDKGTIFFNFLTPKHQASFFIGQLVRNQESEKHKFKLIKWVIDNAIPFEFAYEIFNQFKIGSEDEKIFTNDQYKDLAVVLIARSKLLAMGKPIWEKFPIQSRYMLDVWGVDLDKKSLNDYVKQHLDGKNETVISLLKVFVGYIHSTEHPTPYYGDFQKDSYEGLKQNLDNKFIYEKVDQIVPFNLSIIDQYQSLGHNQTDDNMIKQFAYWYNKDANDIMP